MKVVGYWFTVHPLPRLAGVILPLLQLSNSVSPSSLRARSKNVTLALPVPHSGVPNQPLPRRARRPDRETPIAKYVLLHSLDLLSNPTSTLRYARKTMLISPLSSPVSLPTPHPLDLHTPLHPLRAPSSPPHIRLLRSSPRLAHQITISPLPHKHTPSLCRCHSFRGSRSRSSCRRWGTHTGSKNRVLLSPEQEVLSTGILDATSSRHRK